MNDITWIQMAAEATFRLWSFPEDHIQDHGLRCVGRITVSRHNTFNWKSKQLFLKKIFESGKFLLFV